MQPLPCLVGVEMHHVLPVLLQTAQVMWDAGTGQGADTVLKESDGNKVLDHIKLFIGITVLLRLVL